GAGAACGTISSREPLSSTIGAGTGVATCFVAVRLSAPQAMAPTPRPAAVPTATAARSDPWLAGCWIARVEADIMSLLGHRVRRQILRRGGLRGGGLHSRSREGGAHGV